MNRYMLDWHLDYNFIPPLSDEFKSKFVEAVEKYVNGEIDLDDVVAHHRNGSPITFGEVCEMLHIYPELLKDEVLMKVLG